MNQETIAFTLVVSVLGVIVVFAALWLISLMITALTKLTAGKGTEKARVSQLASTDSKQTGRKSASPVPKWVIAAAATYLMDESLEMPRSAQPWVPDSQQTADLWLMRTYR